MTSKNSVKNNTHKTAWAILYIILAISLGLEYFMHPHAFFTIDGTIFFYAWYGFVSCAAIIVISKFVALFLKRKENYYD